MDPSTDPATDPAQQSQTDTAVLPCGSSPATSHPAVEVARLFFKLGCIAFGGPAAHIAMMEDEVVTRRGWMTHQHFLDLVGATNLIPGPNSTEMTMHVGYERAGRLGLVAGGGLFILPAAIITGFFAWLYVRYGSLPAVEPFFYGIKPAVLAVIVSAVWRLGRQAIKGWQLAVVGAAVTGAVLLGINELLALLVGAVIGGLWLRVTPGGVAAVLLLIPTLTTSMMWQWDNRARQLWTGLATTVPYAPLQESAQNVPLGRLFLFFLKVGVILYGSGYVLIAFLEGDLVQNYGWLTQTQLLDAIAVGQLTPGPVSTTATFIGYVLGGVPGAIVATLGIFLPAFVFVLVLNPLVPRLRQSVWTAAFMDAVNAAAVALMAAVTVRLGGSILVSWPAWVIFGLAAVAVLRFKVGSIWLVLGGAVLGYVLLRVAGG